MLARWEFHLSQPIGKLASAMGSETSQTAKAYAAGVSIIVLVINTVIYVIVSMMISWKVTLIALAAGLFIWYPLNRFVKKARKAGRRQVKVRIGQCTRSLWTAFNPSNPSRPWHVKTGRKPF